MFKVIEVTLLFCFKYTFILNLRPAKQVKEGKSYSMLQKHQFGPFQRQTGSLMTGDTVVVTVGIKGASSKGTVLHKQECG